MENQPSKTLTLRILENEYEINFPTNGQLIDIETYKAALSKGTENNLLMSTSLPANIAFITIEMVATFTHVIPDFKKDLMGGKDLLDLNPIESKPLREAYIEQYLPWYNDWMKLINEDVKVEVEEPVGDEDEEVIEAK